MMVRWRAYRAPPPASAADEGHAGLHGPSRGRGHSAPSATGVASAIARVTSARARARPLRRALSASWVFRALAPWAEAGAAIPVGATVTSVIAPRVLAELLAAGHPKARHVAGIPGGLWRAPLRIRLSGAAALRLKAPPHAGPKERLSRRSGSHRTGMHARRYPTRFSQFQRMTPSRGRVSEQTARCALVTPV